MRKQAINGFYINKYGFIKLGSCIMSQDRLG